MNISSLTSLSQSGSNINELVETFMEDKRKPVEDLKNQKSNASKEKNIYLDLKSKLKELRQEAKTFKEVGEEAVLTSKSVESSDTSTIQATVDSTAEEGIISIKVNRLADRDFVVSDKFANSSSNSIAEKLKNTTQTFSIGIGDGEQAEISITFDDENETNESVLGRIASEIKNSGLDISAYTITDTSSSVRLTISSESSGSDNRVVFGTGSDLLKELGIVKSKNSSERLQASGDDGGFLKADTSDLDAQFTFNGVNVTRGSNTVTDLVDGLSLSLLSVQEESEAPVTLTISRNEETIKNQITSFIEKYNNAVKYLNEKSKVDTTTYTRGALAGNATYTILKLNLRNIVISSVEGLEEENINRLSEIGISYNRDGTLSITDEDELEEAINTKGEQVEDLFNSENGIAQKFDTVLERYVQTGGTIDDSKRMVENRIESIENRISSYEKRLEREEESLRKKFVELQKSLSMLSSQQRMIQNSMNILRYGFGSYLGY